LASSPTEHRFRASDGAELVWYEVGEGRPLLLLHGLFSDADTNWIKFGHSAELAGKGRRVIMSDLRAHGRSAKPHDEGSYPPDILARDAMELVGHLGLTDYDLGGYSLGGRTAVRMVVLGATPGKLIVSGMGLQGLLDTGRRAAHFRKILTGLGTFERGTPEWMAEAFLKTTKGDPDALLPLLGSFVDTSMAEIGAIAQPTLVLSGAEDHDNGSSEALADALPNGRFVEIPGNHMSAVTKPEMGRAIGDFLAA
jgi:pimeloyl-ACP methyl ester carboxylesterase